MNQALPDFFEPSGIPLITGVITLFLGVLAPLAAQDRTPPVSADSVLPLPELRVEVVRLRTGSVPIADVPFPVQIIAGSNFQGATGSSVADALTGSAGGQRHEPNR